MSTWISKILSAAALLGAAACLPQGTTSREGPPPNRMAVAGGAVVVAGPKGFCVDRAASRDDRGRMGLSVLSSCRGLGQSGFGTDPAHRAVLTAVVAPEPGEILVGPAAPDLTRFFLTQRGRALLSRAGRAETVRIQELLSGDDAYLMHLTDTAGFAWGPVQADYWRALLPVGGRMVTLSVLALPDSPLGRNEGLALLQAFIAATKTATAAYAAAATSVEASPAGAKTPTAPRATALPG